MAPIIFELAASRQVEIILCGSGQHNEMLHQALNIFGLKLDIDLKVMTQNQNLDILSSKLMLEITKTILDCSPDLVLVHGDTLTAFCGALAAFYCKVPVVHVEAGLRTHNILEPFPEEFNRQAIARIADLNFAPTHVSRDNLISEGIAKSKIFISGNTIVDSLDIMKARFKNDSLLQAKVFETFKNFWNFDHQNTRFVLVTMHRREKFGAGVASVCEAIQELAYKFPELMFIFPVHLNPKVADDVHSFLGQIENIFLTPPLPYDEFFSLLSNAIFVITDSGGIQEEAVSLGKKVLVTRNNTERQEGLESGLIEIVAYDKVRISDAASKTLSNPISEKMNFKNPFGQIGVSKIIVDKILSQYLK
jgi:UDP-N-acetylglucosamine 2-epimerase (non-hydrolysing)